MRTLNLSADRLISLLVQRKRAAVLDSCGVGHLGSHLLIAGVEPVETIEMDGPAAETLHILSERLSHGLAAVFTVSYDFGLKLQNISSRHKKTSEPDIYLALFDSLVVHDYAKNRSFICGRRSSVDLLDSNPTNGPKYSQPERSESEDLCSNLTRTQYLEAIETIKERIRCGETYQTNLTQRLSAPIRNGDSPGEIFIRLRHSHPAPFAAFIDRGTSQVISASPERFFKIDGRTVRTSPIKGTRRRGKNEAEDDHLRQDLISSEKDRAENTMIVDLLRNDLGRVSEYGCVNVTKLCDLEEHPSLFHLVSTIEGRLRKDVEFADVLMALFPCGSITGAPKIKTMQIIDELEPSRRGLSMGAIGYFVPETGFDGLRPGFDLSVAIRTMVIRDMVAAFNVGGGITIDSDPAAEFDESMLKAKALITALRNK
jgi:para-aminobenzoate synthetase component 1